MTLVFVWQRHCVTYTATLHSTTGEARMLVWSSLATPSYKMTTSYKITVKMQLLNKNLFQLQEKLPRS